MKDSFIAYHYYDNWHKFPYHFRYLDAIASLFHVQTDVIASLEVKSILYLSYNADLNKINKERANLVKNIITKIDSYNEDDILGVYLLFNMDFISLAKKTRNHVDEKSKKIIESFIHDYDFNKSSIDKKLKKILTSNDLENYTQKVVNGYKEIIDLFLQDNNLQKHLNAFLRPMQDSYKLYLYLKDTNIIKDVIVLDNPNNVHADSNLVHHFSDGEYLDKNYMGVSKLCCGYCHNYLEKNHYNHRGTHGVCDDKWKLPWPKKDEISPIENNFKNSVKQIKEFNQLNPPPQNRRLSIDDFEKNISVKLHQSNEIADEFIISSDPNYLVKGVTQYDEVYFKYAFNFTNLWNLKNDSGLIPINNETNTFYDEYEYDY